MGISFAYIGVFMAGVFLPSVVLYILFCKTKKQMISKIFNRRYGSLFEF